MLAKEILLAAAIVLLIISNAMAQTKGARAVLGACKPDIRAYCSEILPGGGRVKACMKQHLHELSEPCKEALFQAWLRQ